MYGGLAAHHATRELDGAVRDDLVRVHVALGAATGLEHHQREVLVELALDHLVGGPHDEVGDVGRQLAELRVRLGGTLLQDAQRTDDRATPHERVAADREVVDAALGLSAPVLAGVDLQRAHGV
jgi:hypothetical protein